MGQSSSKLNLDNKCDCSINNSKSIQPEEYKKYNGFGYVYFPLKKFTLDKEHSISFSWFDKSNQLQSDYARVNLKYMTPTKINVNKKSYREYSIETEEQNHIKLRFGSRTKLVFISQFN